MNITISARAKSLQSLPINPIHCTDKQHLQSFQQKRSVKDTQSHELNYDSCEPSQVTRWLMRNCFTKTNSILEDQSQEQEQHNHKLLIHSLSSRRAKQDMGNKQQIQESNAASTRHGSPLRSKGVKIKVETGKEASKTARILRLKTCQAKMNVTTIPTSCSTSGHASRQRLNEKILQTVQKQVGETKSLAHLEENGSILLSRHNWKFDSEQKHRIQDCIYEPIFSLDYMKKRSERSALSTPQKQRTFKFGESPSQIDSDESFIISKGLEQIFQISAGQNSPQLRNQPLKHGSQSKMFVIYQKNDETLQYE